MIESLLVLSSHLSLISGNTFLFLNLFYYLFCIKQAIHLSNIPIAPNVAHIFFKNSVKHRFSTLIGIGCYNTVPHYAVHKT